MFNAEILHHGCNIISAQFEKDQPPEYALTNPPFIGQELSGILIIKKEGVVGPVATTT
jgi:hypothetical protein